MSSSLFRLGTFIFIFEENYEEFNTCTCRKVFIFIYKQRFQTLVVVCVISRQ